MMLLRARDNNFQSFAYTWLHKGNQNEFLNHPKTNFIYKFRMLNEFLKHPKINFIFNFRMLKEFVLIFFKKPGVRKTLKISFRMIKEFVLISFMKPGVRKTLNVYVLLCLYSFPSDAKQSKEKQQ